MSSYSDKMSLVKRAFGVTEISRDKLNVAVKCPKCASLGTAKKKLVIKLDNGMYHCWVCGLKGRKIDRLFQKYSPAHIEEAKKIFSISRNLISEDIDNDEEIKVEIPRGFQLLGKSLRARDPDIQETIRYVRSRGLTTRDIWHYRLGTCTQGKFRRRVIVPSFDSEGNLNYFSGRTIDKDIKMKYMNASVSKTSIIFNEINVNWKKELLLVEGPFDLMKCPKNATCLLGSHLSTSSILFQKIVKNQTPIALALDPDAIKKTHEIAKSLNEYGVLVKILNVPEGADVGDLNIETVKELMKVSAVWHFEDRLRNMIGSLQSGSLI